MDQPSSNSEDPLAAKRRLKVLLEEKQERRLYNKAKYWATEMAYPWQWNLANASKDSAQILAMAANQVGKTSTGAWITAVHLTGLYPKDWLGKKFQKPIKAWACGISNESTRNILQTNLLGEPGDPAQQGTGFIPKHCILETTRKPQVPNAIQSVLIRHFSPLTGNQDGVSRCDFKAYEQGEAKFMGLPMDWIWLDEQPADGIYTQCITRTVSTNGIMMMTFTPEDGVNRTIHQFMNDIKPGQRLIQATWDDAPHLSEERKTQLLSQYGRHEARMRSMGIPVFGSGLVFPLPDEDLMIDPIELPQEWPRVCGLDFGWDHPTAAVWMAWDRDTDTVYIYSEYRQDRVSAQQHAPAIKQRGPWVPVIWPHDGMSHEKGSGIGLADQFRAQGVNMTIDHHRNPIAPGESGKGNIKIEPGINAMLQAMENGQFKVFSSCAAWFQEKSMYYRGDDGKIVPLKDDLMSATRYAFQNRARFAKTQAESNLTNKYNGQPLPIISRGTV